MANKNIINQIWWQLAIFVIVSSGAAVVSVHFKEKLSRYVPEAISNPSTLNKKASGTSGLYELTKLIGLRSHLWKLPYRDLKNVNGQLVIIGPKQSFNKFEREILLEWVAEGNCLVYLDQFSNPFSKTILESLAIWTYTTKPFTEVSAIPQPNLRTSRFVGPVKVSYRTAFSPNIHYVTVLKCGNDNVLIELSHGKGKLLIGTTANLAANSHLADNAANFQLLGNWLRLNNSTVYFDERCHGFTQSRNLITSLLSGTSGILFAQLLVIFGLAVASSAQRFGQRLNYDNPRKISNLEFVQGIANSYQRARATHLASNVLSHNLRLKLAKALGQSTGDDEALATLYVDGIKDDHNQAEEKARLIKTLAHSQMMNQSHISNQELADLSAYCDKIQETLDSRRRKST